MNRLLAPLLIMSVLTGTALAQDPEPKKCIVVDENGPWKPPVIIGGGPGVLYKIQDALNQIFAELRQASPQGYDIAVNAVRALPQDQSDALNSIIGLQNNWGGTIAFGGGAFWSNFEKQQDRFVTLDIVADEELKSLAKSPLYYVGPEKWKDLTAPSAIQTEILRMNGE